MGVADFKHPIMRTTSLSLLLVLLAVICVQQSSGLFFYLKEGQNKCFLEDLPKDTVVIVTVDASDIPENAVLPGDASEFSRRKNADTEPIVIKGTIFLDKQLIIENTVDARGRFAFTSQEPGEHKICLKTDSSRWFGAGAIKLDI